MTKPVREPSRWFPARCFGDERGVALVMALMVLLMLSSLSLAFVSISSTEPTIASNHFHVAQARALAESGLERVFWALATSNLTPPGSGSVAASPWDGGTFDDGSTWRPISETSGGYTVRVTGVSTVEVNVESEGWTPTVGRPGVAGYSAGDARVKAHRKIAATIMRYPDFGIQTPCALCVRGDLVVEGAAAIDSRADTSCGQKYGTTTAGNLCVGGGSCSGNNGTIYGAIDGNNTPNQANDYQSNVAWSSFDAFTLSPSQLDALRATAQSLGTYYSGGTHFNSSNQIPTGKPVVFVDGNVTMTGNPYAGDAFNGWLIVNGSIVVNGNGTINGLLYTVDDVSSSAGTNIVNGLVVSQNRTNASGIDSSAGGTMTITFNCANARGGGLLPTGWFLKPRTYREPAG